MATIHIFVSYAHEDKRWFQRDGPFGLIPWLADSLRKQDVVFWHDENLIPGNFTSRIQEEIDRAEIAVLLVSQAFLNSTYIEEVELPRIKDLKEQAKLEVLPILVHACEWEGDDFLRGLQILPGKPTPLINYTKNEYEWDGARFEILAGLRRLIERVRSAKAEPKEAAAAQPQPPWNVPSPGALPSTAQPIMVPPAAPEETIMLPPEAPREPTRPPPAQPGAPRIVDDDVQFPRADGGGAAHPSRPVPSHAMVLPLPAVAPHSQDPGAGELWVDAQDGAERDDAPVGLVRMGADNSPYNPRQAVLLDRSRLESFAPASSDAKWDVFISAKSTDYPLALQVLEFLEAKAIKAFLSDRSLPELGNSDYRKEIDRALEQARHMVVVASSRENVEAPWVEAEWGFFINEKRSGSKRGNIVTVLAGGLLPNSLPPSLRYYETLKLDTAGLQRLLAYVRS